MTSIELATWVLVFFTACLFFATCAYAYYSYRLFRSSEGQQEIMKNQQRLLKEQIEEMKNHTVALHSQAEVINRLGLTISELPYDAQEIKDKRLTYGGPLKRK